MMLFALKRKKKEEENKLTCDCSLLDTVVHVFRLYIKESGKCVQRTVFYSSFFTTINNFLITW